MILLQTPLAATDSIPAVHEELSKLSTLTADEFLNKLVSSTVTFAIHLATAILVFYIGRFIINKIYKITSSIFVRRQLDHSLATFVLSMVRIVLYFLLIITVIGILGVETSSFIAIFASAGVAVGMALSGMLQNFAGGVLILLLKPYKIGDFIEAQGYSGTVRDIQIFSTIITTPNNKSIIIPNGGLSTGTINNYNREDYRRVDWVVSISYGDDVDRARQAILDIIAGDERVVKQYIEDDRRERNLAKKIVPSELFNSKPVDRSPVVRVNELAASSVDLKVSVWTPASAYWDVYYSLNERFYKELPAAGINFPFPQLDVHLQQ